VLKQLDFCTPHPKAYGSICHFSKFQVTNKKQETILRWLSSNFSTSMANPDLKISIPSTSICVAVPSLGTYNITHLIPASLKTKKQKYLASSTE
jgi:hypothetical protein